MMPTIGYWNHRGLGQPIRLVFAYVGQEWQETDYTTYWDEKKEVLDQREWYDVKFKLGLPFPGLPFLIDGDIKMTQSVAILSYLGRKFDLMGKTEQARVYNDMLLQLVHEEYWKFVTIAFHHFEEQSEGYRASLPAVLKTYEDYLGNKHWLAGDDITVCDFHFYDYLDIMKHFEPNCLNAFGNLQKFCERFEQLPTIQTYMKSDKFRKWPIFHKLAQWGSV